MKLPVTPRLPVSLLWWVAACLLPLSADAAVTPEQRAQVQQLVSLTREAGEMYSQGQFVESAAKVSEIQQQLVALMESRDPALQRMVRPIYTRLGRAHALLELEGAQLQALPSWEELTQEKPDMPDEPGTTGVSFKTDVAPWLISACGNCHITNRRGQFSMATFADLLRGPPAGTVLFAGSAKGSRIVEVIESGDMPRGNAKVTPEQLTSLKQWIDEGAKFDGPQPTDPLPSYAAGGSEPPEMKAPEVQQATGSETVSFASDVAPLLTEHCNGCHIAGRQASGNFRMDTFAQLLRGGDSGPVIAPTKADESLLIKKLKGESGQRMPAGGRPPLSTEQIELISTWIKEGATFDGPAPNTNIDTVVNQAWASQASHETLFERRQSRALASWKRVLPNDEPASGKSDEVFVLGNVPSARIDKIVDLLGDALALTKKQLAADPRAPLIKGGLAVFVLKSRYDYSEFGRMTENRELPKEWLGHWQADPLDVYGVLSGETGIDDEQLESVCLQIVSGAYLGSFSEVPNWFAEGVARNLVISTYRRSDERVQQWQRSLPSARQKVDNAKTLLDGRLDEETAGVVGMALSNFMMDRSNRRRFDQLLTLLREGKSFAEATSMTYAPPETLVKTWLGK